MRSREQRRGRNRKKRGESAVVVTAAVFFVSFRRGVPSCSSSTPNPRPLSLVKLPLRKLAEIALDIVKDAAAPKEESAAAAAAAARDGGAKQDEDDDESHDHDLRGDREFLTAATAEEALGPMLAPGAAHARIRFSTKSFGAEAAAVAARALANVSATLRHADLSDIIAGRNENDALDALRTIAAALAEAPFLESLDVSDNALGEKGVRALAAALKRGAAATSGGEGGAGSGNGAEGSESGKGSSRTPLRSVAMRNVGASVHACAALAETLEHAGELRSLHFHNNMSGDEGATFLASIVERAPKLAFLRVASSRVGQEGGKALAGALCAAAKEPGGGGGSLLSLDLSDNPLTSAAGPSLSLAVACHRSLRRLVLADTGLLDAGVAQVCAALARGAAPGLEELDLSLNEVTAVGARSISAALSKSLKKLKILNVRENELENAGAKVLAAGLAACPSLTTLDASSNQLRRPGAVALAKAVAKAAENLKLLALDENEISEEGVEEVEEILRGAGKAEALGPLDDNDGDGDDDDEEAEEAEEEEEEEAEEEEEGNAASCDGIDLDLSRALDAALKI